MPLIEYRFEYLTVLITEVILREINAISQSLLLIEELNKEKMTEEDEFKMYKERIIQKMENGEIKHFKALKDLSYPTY
jgi:hypothetical protein